MATATRTLTKIDPGDVDKAIYLAERAYWLALHVHRTHRGKRLDLKHYPYIHAILRDGHKEIVWKKSTQGSATEVAIIRGLGWMEYGLNIFWVLPTGTIKRRFVRNRFDLSVGLTDWYRGQTGNSETRMMKGRLSESVDLKHYAYGAVAFVPSMSVAGFGEFPADVDIIDEYDYCDQDNLAMAEERLSNSEYRIKFHIGNPTIPNFGISRRYKESDQKRWYITGECGHTIRPQWDKHVVRSVDENTFEVIDPEWDGPEGVDARMICDQCGKPIYRSDHGEWIVENPASVISGYHNSKLFTTKMTMNELLIRFEKGLSNPTEAQRFWNGDMGEEHTEPGAHLTVEDIEKCVGDHGMVTHADRPCFVGIDVGSVMHVVVGEPIEDEKTRVLWMGIVHVNMDVEELSNAIIGFDWRSLVIDELPERRLARKIAYRSRRAWMCRYAEGKRDMINPKSKVVSVDRVVALDRVVEAFNLERIILPRDAMNVPDFVDQMTALTRVFDKEANGGNGAYVWAGDQADHYFHAMGYMLTARQLVIRR